LWSSFEGKECGFVEKLDADGRFCLYYEETDGLLTALTILPHLTSNTHCLDTALLDKVLKY
jgi:hypothetical protein